MTDKHDFTRTSQRARHCRARIHKPKPRGSDDNDGDNRQDGIIKPCARTCVDKFIATNYLPDTCKDSQSRLTCLCTKRSRSGYTIGEGALGCLVSSCQDRSPLDLLIYGICADVHGALPNTHSVVQATVTTAPVSASQNLVTSVSPSISTTSTSSAATTVRFTSSRVGTSSTSATSATSSQTNKSSAYKPSRSENALAAGTISGSVGAAFLVGLLLCLFIRWRKRCHDRKKADTSPFIGGWMEQNPYFDSRRLTNRHEPMDMGDSPVRSLSNPLGTVGLTDHTEPMGLTAENPIGLGTNPSWTGYGLPARPRLSTVTIPWELLATISRRASLSHGEMAPEKHRVARDSCGTMFEEDYQPAASSSQDHREKRHIEGGLTPRLSMVDPNEYRFRRFQRQDVDTDINHHEA